MFGFVANEYKWIAIRSLSTIRSGIRWTNPKVKNTIHCYLAQSVNYGPKSFARLVAAMKWQLWTRSDNQLRFSFIQVVKTEWRNKTESHIGIFSGARSPFRPWPTKAKPGNTKGEVSLYRWPPVWLVQNQLYNNWQFLFLFAKQTNPNQFNRKSTVQR